MDSIEGHHPQLKEYRSSIDNIDAALIFLLAERFKITKKVGHYKKENTLPPGDPEREKRQIKRLKELSKTADLDPVFAAKFIRFIASEVIKNHEHIRDGED